ncbi:MAG: NAD(P)/FAD-dependent oxidoreductase [Campylobacterales bacterium]
MALNADRLYDCLIVGGGAAGLMAATRLKGLDFLLLEGAPKVGQKLSVCGGGYANVTRTIMDSSFYLGDRALIEPVLKAYDREWLLGFLRSLNVPLEIREGGFYFCKIPAKELSALFERSIGRDKIRVSTRVRGVAKAQNGFEVTTDRGVLKSRSVLIATGGPSYPALGASGDGAAFAAALGHSAVPFAPVLSGLTLQSAQMWMKELSGIALGVEISVSGRIISGNLLFAHRGISGPAVLNASLWWRKGPLSIDFLPGFDLQAAIDRGGQKTPLSLTSLPKRFIKAFMESEGIEPKAVSKLTETERQRLLSLKRYVMAPAGTFGLTKAEACRGGVCAQEIEAQTMQSRLVPGVFFAGEVLDVTGEVGGYNLQWAFSSAAVAADAIRQRVKGLSPN